MPISLTALQHSSLRAPEERSWPFNSSLTLSLNASAFIIAARGGDPCLSFLEEPPLTPLQPKPVHCLQMARFYSGSWNVLSSHIFLVRGFCSYDDIWNRKA